MDKTKSIRDAAAALFLTALCGAALIAAPPASADVCG